jgi:hypothetical protein
LILFFTSRKTCSPIEPKNSFLPPRWGRIQVGGKVQDVHPHPALPPSIIRGKEMR